MLDHNPNLAVIAGMRWFLIFTVALISAWPAHAQRCPFKPGEARADTLDLRGYFPLDVGNMWEYVSQEGVWLTSLVQHEIVGDTLIEDQDYAVRRSAYYDYLYHPRDSPRIEERLTVSRSYVRTDDEGRIHQVEGSDHWVSHYELGQPFASCYRARGGEGSYAVALELPQYGDSLAVSMRAMHLQTLYQGVLDTITTYVVKNFAWTNAAGSGASVEYAHGIGMLQSGVEFSATSLTYARINGREYGTPLRERFNIVVSTESAEALREQRLDVYPNPVREVANIQFELDRLQAVSLEVVDVTGRVVARLLDGEQRAAGTHTVMWRVSSVPPGVYGFRLTGTAGLRQHRSIVVMR